MYSGRHSQHQVVMWMCHTSHFCDVHDLKTNIVTIFIYSPSVEVTPISRNLDQMLSVCYLAINGCVDMFVCNVMIDKIKAHLSEISQYQQK